MLVRWVRRVSLYCSQLPGNRALSETGSPMTASSTGESANSRSLLMITAQKASFVVKCCPRTSDELIPLPALADGSPKCTPHKSVLDSRSTEGQRQLARAILAFDGPKRCQRSAAPWPAANWVDQPGSMKFHRTVQEHGGGGERLPLYAARIEDLGSGDFVKVDCAPATTSRY